MIEVGIALLVCGAGVAYVWMMLKRLGIGGRADCGCGSGKGCRDRDAKDANSANHKLVNNRAVKRCEHFNLSLGIHPEGANPLKSGEAIEPVSMDKHFGRVTFRRDPKGESP